MPTYHMAAEEDNELSLFKLTNVKLTDAQNAMTRTILRSVVRVQSLARGNLSFFLLLLLFSCHIFFLTDNKYLISFYVDTHYFL